MGLDEGYRAGCSYQGHGEKMGAAAPEEGSWGD